MQITPEYIPHFPPNNKSTLIDPLAWRQANDKVLSEPVMVQRTEVFLRRSAFII